MAGRHRRNVIPLPVLKGSSIHDALTGFAPQIEQNTHLGRRVEHALTVVAAEIRGWQAVAARVGDEIAERFGARALDRATEAVEALGGNDVSVGGTPTQPVVTATFGGEHHAMRALVAAQAVRDVTARTLHPSMSERFHACVGVNGGVVIRTHLNGSGVEFQSTGTIRMFAVRLHEFAGPDQILLSESTCRAVPARLDVLPIGPVRTNGDGQTSEAYVLRGLVADDAVSR